MVKSATPWVELRELAKRQFKGHYKANPREMPEVQPEYIELAKSRLYEGDGRTVQASFDDTIHHFPTGTDSNLRRAPDHVYGFLEAVGAKLIPHGSQGEPVYDSVIRGELARGEGELDHGSFFDHLVGNEQCLREWQLIDGEDKFDDAVCLAGLFHSVYGTQGYQAAQFPVEKRAELVALIGERAENLAYWTCAMERPTWREMVLENKGLRRGETPVGSFSGRRSSLGKPVDTVWTGEEDWKLTAQEFTDMCAVQLSHVLKQANNGDEAMYRDEAIMIMAEHVGGCALEQYNAELAAASAAADAEADSSAMRHLKTGSPFASKEDDEGSEEEEAAAVEAESADVDDGTPMARL